MPLGFRNPPVLRFANGGMLGDGRIVGFCDLGLAGLAGLALHLPLSVDGALHRAVNIGDSCYDGYIEPAVVLGTWRHSQDPCDAPVLLHLQHWHCKLRQTGGRAGFV